MSKYGLIETAKRQKGKTITLGLLFLMMSVVWGKTLVGGEEDPRAKRKASSSSSASKSASTASKSEASSKSVSSSSKKKSAASKASTKAPKSIKDFTTAIARLDAWAVPLRIERKGPLTDEYVAQVRAAARAEDEARSQRFAQAREAGQLAAAADSNSALLALPDQLALDAVEQEPVEAPPAAPLIVAEDMEVDLTLTGTALLGDTRFALFGERRVQEGDQIGRYRVHAVRSREVDVVIDGKLTVIRIAPPDLD